jgi:5-formyltetrahydrofolate cyclo-ligase
LKDELRVRFRTLRDALGPARRAQASTAITTAVLGLARFRDARRILLYASFGSEVDTMQLRRSAHESGKSVLLPRMDGRALSLHEWRQETSLVPNRHGIPEPAEGSEAVDARDVDVVVVPGLAFDERGGRLGYGGGYYDRLLSTIPKAYRVGVCFANQVVRHLPTTRLDVPMDCVVTEEAVKSLPRRHH